jgi:hypothetical protein
MGRLARRIEDFLVFSGFVLSNRKVLKLSKAELQLVSTGIHSVPIPERQQLAPMYGSKVADEARKLKTGAKRLNTQVRKHLLTGAPPADTAKLNASLNRLQKKAKAFSEKLHSFCRLDPPPTKPGK